MATIRSSSARRNVAARLHFPEIIGGIACRGLALFNLRIGSAAGSPQAAFTDAAAAKILGRSCIWILLCITPTVNAASEQSIIEGLHIQDFPAPAEIWDGQSNDSVNDLVSKSALLWGLHQLKKNRLAPGNTSPLPQDVSGPDAWENSARQISALMNQEYSWLQIEFAEEILGITSANLLPYGNNPEEAYALRTFFPELYRQYLASNR